LPGAADADPAAAAGALVAGLALAIEAGAAGPELAGLAAAALGATEAAVLGLGVDCEPHADRQMARNAATNSLRVGIVSRMRAKAAPP
jgi:hypothetical protein